MTTKEADMPRPLSIGGRVYRLALSLHPPAFHREFAQEMARDFEEAHHEAWMAGQWRGLLAFWTAIGVDIVSSTARQWMRTGLPMIVLVSATVAIVAAGAAAQIVVGEPMTPPAELDDRDLLMLILLISTALGVIFGTIIFTFWFTRPLLRRRPPCSRRVV
jgi:hypothetical protein